ncbi:hypothetical protein PR048_011510 [Dryococelus australis]|uniref:Uncharacterized protein n=1 Tax=Dryococelus australis TaxID=614101 RepID=A0ABQ9HLS6_9NEOP|nr:hypothetical protein PR048_011510 [Dryococelus australis]
MDTSDMYYLRKLCTSFGSNFSINENGEKVSWNEIKEIKIEEEEPYEIKYKLRYEANEYSIINVYRRKRGRHSGTHELTPAYTQATGISAAKKRDLLLPFEAKHLKPQYHEFFKSLRVSADLQEGREH